MSVYDFEVETIRGETQALAAYRGQVLLIVNTATKCGFAPQFAGLQQLHDKYQDQGFSVLGFPCDQFAHQEPGDNAQIAQACEMNFGVKFPLFAKIEVNGRNAHPLYRYLSGEAHGLLGSRAIKWNFTKFLVDREGNVVERFAPKDPPEKLEDPIKQLL